MLVRDYSRQWRIILPHWRNASVISKVALDGDLVLGLDLNNIWTWPRMTQDSFKKPSFLFSYSLHFFYLTQIFFSVRKYRVRSREQNGSFLFIALKSFRFSCIQILRFFHDFPRRSLIRKSPGWPQILRGITPFEVTRYINEIRNTRT